MQWKLTVVCFSIQYVINNHQMWRRLNHSQLGCFNSISNLIELHPSHSHSFDLNELISFSFCSSIVYELAQYIYRCVVPFLLRLIRSNACETLSLSAWNRMTTTEKHKKKMNFSIDYGRNQNERKLAMETINMSIEKNIFNGKFSIAFNDPKIKFVAKN